MKPENAFEHTRSLFWMINMERYIAVCSDKKEKDKKVYDAAGPSGCAMSGTNYRK